jgi:DNA-binding protein HU-beta
VNRRDLVNAVANHTGRDRKEVDEVLKGFTDVVTAVVAKGEPVAISGFAKFVKVDRPARMGRNPQTGQPVRIKASKKARITPLKAFKDSVMAPSTAPKLTRGTWPPAPAPAKKAASPAAKKAAPARKSTASKAAATRKTAATRKSAASRTTAAARPASRKTVAKKTTAAARKR